MAVVGAATHETLTGLSVGKTDMLERAVGLREADQSIPVERTIPRCQICYAGAAILAKWRGTFSRTRPI